MANEMKIGSSSMLVTTNQVIEKLQAFAKATSLEFSDYERTCVANAIRTIDPMLASNNMNWNSLDINNVMGVLQQTAFLKLNPSATPRECYFLVRKNWNAKEKKTLPPTLEFGIEGMGNDTILRNFGVGVKDIKSYLIFDGDTYDLGETDGWETILPKHRRAWKSNKAIHVVYLIKKSDGDIEVLTADRDDVKKSLLANARTNGADEKLIRELDKHTIDVLLEDPKWIDYKIKKSYGSNNYESPLFSPAWTSPISRESMIQRKLRNHAVRRYPKNFNPEIQALYEDTFEDEKYTRPDVIDVEETLEKSKVEFKKNSGKKQLETASQGEKIVIKNEPEIEEKVLVSDEETGEIVEDEIEEIDEIEESGDEEEDDNGEPEVANDVPSWL